ncbi:hypothetical protein [uncultured Clostridium sp.]|uniref:LiaF transmembrane domain-containing protein n=1 Tax=uncultured Clostridium sp. TaxID=59620 RepID=UPI002622F93D|nr:hypothetical protein [uncultured Clostridium sp.]
MKKRSVFWGLLLIIASILLVLTDIKGFHLRSGLDIVVTIILLGIFIESLIKINFYGIIFPIGLTYLIYQEEFKLYKLNIIIVLLGSLLLSVGLSMIFKRNNRKMIDIFSRKEKVKLKESYDIEAKVHLGETITYVTNEFRDGYLESSFGAIKVYFDKSNIEGTDASFEINSLCAGVELYVPKEWQIVNGITNILSGVNEEGKYINVEKKSVLRLTGISKLSGITIKYV